MGSFRGYRVVYSLILAKSLLLSVSNLYSCVFFAKQNETQCIAVFSSSRRGVNSLVIAEKRVLILTNLDRRTTKLGDQNLVARLDRRSNALSIAVKGTGANSQNLGLVELLDGGLGEEDTAGGLGLGLDALDEDAVEEGCEGLDGLGGDGGLCGC